MNVVKCKWTGGTNRKDACEEQALQICWSGAVKVKKALRFDSLNMSVTAAVSGCPPWHTPALSSCAPSVLVRLCCDLVGSTPCLPPFSFPHPGPDTPTTCLPGLLISCIRENPPGNRTPNLFYWTAATVSHFVLSRVMSSRKLLPASSKHCKMSTYTVKTLHVNVKATECWLLICTHWLRGNFR